MEASEALSRSEAPAESSEPVSGPENAPEHAPEGEGSEREIERDEQGRILSREAAGYRRRLRETEAERDTLREQLDRLQRSEVERLASGAGLAVAGDVWVHGAELENLRTEDGSIDGDTVTALVGDMLKSRPGLKAQPVGSVGIGKGGNGIRPNEVGLANLFGKR